MEHEKKTEQKPYPRYHKIKQLGNKTTYYVKTGPGKEEYHIEERAIYEPKCKK